MPTIAFLNLSNQPQGDWFSPYKDFLSLQTLPTVWFVPNPSETVKPGNLI
jgi:hypothetical protein